jgi:hypothetical protein
MHVGLYLILNWIIILSSLQTKPSGSWEGNHSPLAGGADTSLARAVAAPIYTLCMVFRESDNQDSDISRTNRQKSFIS